MREGDGVGWVREVPPPDGCGFGPPVKAGNGVRSCDGSAFGLKVGRAGPGEAAATVGVSVKRVR